MRPTSNLTVWLLVSIGAAAAPARAHHSASMFDVERSVTLDGVVTEYQWINPHVYIEIETSDASSGATWVIEGAPPSVMSRLGWSRDSLDVGEPVIVTGHPMRDASKQMLLGSSFIRRDGTVLAIRATDGRANTSSLELMASRDAPRSVAESLAGNWFTPWNPDVALRFLQPGRFWSLTDAGTASVAGYNESVNPYAQCVSEPVPYLMIWPILKNIEIGDDTVIIRFENDVQRTVHMDLRSHEGAPDDVHGHAIGRWDGDALVVDTANFSAHRRGNALGLASGTRKHLVERFELTPDRTGLSYTYELEDPEYLATPVSGVIQMTYRPDLAFETVPCDLDAARRYLE